MTRKSDLLEEANDDLQIALNNKINEAISLRQESDRLDRENERQAEQIIELEALVDILTNAFSAQVLADSLPVIGEELAGYAIGAVALMFENAAEAMVIKSGTPVGDVIGQYVEAVEAAHVLRAHLDACNEDDDFDDEDEAEFWKSATELYDFLTQ